MKLTLISKIRTFLKVSAQSITVCVILILTGCVAEPEYSNTPAITYENIEHFPSEGSDRIDSVVVNISFQDGDGDLGLQTRDSLPPFNLINPDGSQNQYYHNYFAKLQRKENGEFTDLSFADETFSLNGRFPLLNTLGKKTALEGELRFTFDMFYNSLLSPVESEDTIRLEITIVDRSLNESNSVLTDPIVVGVYGE